MSDSPKLSIAIITYNRVGALKQALTAIRQNTTGLPLGLFEVVISDNASEDQTEKMVNRFEGLQIRYFRNEANVGGAANVLLAAERSKGEFVLFHADDDLLCPGAVKILIHTLESFSEIGVVASSLEAFYDSRSEKPLSKLRFPSSKEILYLKKGREAFERFFLRACSLSGLVIRRNLIDIQGAKTGLASQYPQIYLIGAAVKQADAVYLAKPLMRLRLEDVRRWNYESDLMSGAIFSVLENLIREEKWGQLAKKKIVKKRIIASYGPLFTAKQNGWKKFIQIAKNLGALDEYRNSLIFWSMVMSIGLMGCRGVNFVRKLWQGPKGADVIS